MRRLFLFSISVFQLFSFSLPAQTNQLRPWLDYRTIMWVGDSAYKRPEKLPLFFQRLREMGINTAMAYGDVNLQPLLENHFPYYVENMVNRGLCLKWNSKVSDWDKFVTAWAKEGRGEASLSREYCLDDPEWRGWARREMQNIARKNRPDEPLAYNIRDELSTTISANPFDYDFGPVALTRFREWLRTQYTNLAALNTEWETKFATWDEVKPFTTDQIKNRMASGEALPRGKPDWQQVQQLKFDPVEARKSPTRWNFSPWADFRTYMDISLALALDDFRQAAHAVDPSTPVGIEGTQMPAAFGGYDLWRLSQVLDWVEPYDIGNAREILGLFMPGKPIVTTVFETDTNHARRRLWHLLLEGDRGCIVWWSEDCIDWKSDDYALTPKAKALAPVLQEMQSPLARLFLRAERERDPIFIHYSQPSIQVDWLLESTMDGSTWLRRFSSYEADHNRMARDRNAWLKLFQDLGYSPQFISSEQLEQSAFNKPGPAALVLVNSVALSNQEMSGVGEFIGGQRVVFEQGGFGLFDEHAKLRPNNYPRVSGARDSSVIARDDGPIPAPGDIADFSVSRAKGETTAAWSNWVKNALKELRPAIAVPPEARVRIHRFKIPRGQLVAFERNINYHMSEDLKQAGGNEALEKPISLEATLPQPRHIYDLRAQKYVGRTDRIRFTLDPWQPSLFALTEEKLPTESIITQLAE
jgi:hypothetical protein